jgi:predicted dehydrogenase
MGGWHAVAIHRAGARVVAVVDPDEGRAASLAGRYPGSQVFTRLEDALSQTRPAVVHLCTPTATHHQQAEQALKAGANLLVEKPLAPTLEDTQDIFIQAEQNGLVVCPVHQFIFQDGIQRLQAWLPEAGDILQVFRHHSLGRRTGFTQPSWMRCSDILPHLSILQALLPGSPNSCR